MHQLYRDKGGLSKGKGNNYNDYLAFNCLPLRLTSEDLDALQNGGLAAVADFVAKARTEIAKVVRFNTLRGFEVYCYVQKFKKSPTQSLSK
jgi:hypothetical protein